MSGVKFTTREVYKGAPNSMVKRVKEAGGHIPVDLDALVKGVSKKVAHRWLCLKIMRF